MQYETFKATEGELLLETYIRYLQVIIDLKSVKDNCELNFKFLNNLQPEWKQYATMMRQNKNLMEINIDALYNILKQNQGYVNDAMGLKKKTVMVTSDSLALIAEKTKVSKRKEKVVISSDSKGSDADDFSELKKITALLAKAFNRRKFYSKPINNNLRTSSTSQSASKKQEYVKSNDKKVEKKDDDKKRYMSKVKCYNCKKEGHFAKDCKKVKVKDYEYYKTKMLLAKKDKDEKVLLAEDHAWMESSSDSDQEINANMVFIAQIKKVLFDSDASSSSTDDKISEVSYYLFESESESEYETSKYYDNTTTYGLSVNDNYDQENFHDCENFPKNLIESQIDHNESAVNPNDSERIDKLIRKFNKKIAKCLKRIKKANQ
nr:nucleolar protein 58-like [Tanacetum cinerariifolium]